MRRGVRYCAVLVFLDGRSAAVFASDYCTADPKRIKAVSRKALATAREFGLSGRCFAVTDTVVNSFGIADVLAAGLTKAGYEVRRESYRGKFIKGCATPPGGRKARRRPHTSNGCAKSRESTSKRFGSNMPTKSIASKGRSTAGKRREDRKRRGEEARAATQPSREGSRNEEIIP